MNKKSIQENSMLSVGTALRGGAYRIVRYLSSGGFGNTYVAMNQFDELVAIKEFYMRGVNSRGANNDVVLAFPDAYAQFLEQLEKFSKEAYRLRKLKNAHIVAIHDLFDENGTSYYVMDFINGESLGDRLKSTGVPLPEDEALLYFEHILDALREVHSKGFFHLDIKPANILVENKVARLIDFGASKQMLARGGATRTAMCYTPGYAPSEQIDQQLDRFGPWTDLYALGATLYSLLTANKPPCSGDIIDHGEAAFAFPASVSNFARQLVVTLMQPSRKMRPQNVEAVYRLMRELKSNQVETPIEVAPTGGARPKVFKVKDIKKRMEESKSRRQAQAVNVLDVDEADDVEVEAEPVEVIDGEVIDVDSVDERETKTEQWHPNPVAQSQQQLAGYTSNTPVNNNTPIQPQQNNRYEGQLSPKENKTNKELVIGGVVAALIIVAAIVFYLTTGTGRTAYADNPDATNVIGLDVNIDITGPDGKLKRVTYTYDGAIDDSSGRPNGRGVGHYDDGLYEGPYVMGMREGDDATFQDEHTGEIFSGSFKADEPYDGEWKTPDGDTVSWVVYGLKTEEPAK